MPYFHCLSVQQWHDLIHGLSNESVEKMAAGLLADTGSFYLNSLALARIMRHTTVSEPLCTEGLKQCDILLSKIEEPHHKVELMVAWILALSSQKSHPLRKITLTVQLTALASSLIRDPRTYQTHSRFLIEALGNDREVAKAMHATLETIDNPGLIKLKTFVAKRAEPETPLN